MRGGQGRVTRRKRGQENCLWLYQDSIKAMKKHVAEGITLPLVVHSCQQPATVWHTISSHSICISGSSTVLPFSLSQHSGTSPQDNTVRGTTPHRFRCKCHIKSAVEPRRPETWRGCGASFRWCFCKSKKKKDLMAGHMNYVCAVVESMIPVFGLKLRWNSNWTHCCCQNTYSSSVQRLDHLSAASFNVTT